MEHVSTARRPRELEVEVTAETSRRGYRAFAPFYDFTFGLSLQHGRRLAMAALDCNAGDNILEVCIGSGLSLPLYPDGVNVTGIDLSRDMLALAARRIVKLQRGRSVSLIRMNAERMAFADASFDKCLVLYAMAGLPDPVRAMNEISRVCRPGATIAIANHFHSQRPVARACDALLSPIYRLLRYRSDLDLQAFVAAAGLNVTKAQSANLFGYSTVLVCRNRQIDQLIGQKAQAERYSLNHPVIASEHSMGCDRRGTDTTTVNENGDKRQNAAV